MKPFLILLLLGILLGCDKAELKDRNYPLFNVTVSDIDETGVTFHADIESSGNCTFTDYGIAFALQDAPLMKSSSYRKTFESFQLRQNIGLIKNKIYIYSTYVKTKDGIIYGEFNQFFSLGSSSHTIQDIFPNEGVGGTTVTIVVKNLSDLTENNKVISNGNQQKIIYHSGDTLKAELLDYNKDTTHVNVSVYGIRHTINKSFSFYKPKITGYSKEGSSYVIHGENLIINKTKPIVFINMIEQEVLSYSNNQIYFIPKTEGKLYVLSGPRGSNQIGFSFK